MNSQRKLSYDSLPFQKNLYRVQGNDKNTVNFIIKKKSPLQSLNERIMQVTSDIRHHKIQKFKNHSDHKFSHQFSPTSSHKSSQRYESLRYPSLKFNYGPQQTDFNSKPQYYPTNYQVRNNIPSKVNFFYDNPVKINSKNLKTNQNEQKSQKNPVYRKAYESTDFILFSHNHPDQRKSSSKNKINFNYNSKDDTNSQHLNFNEKSSTNYNLHQSKRQFQKPMTELQKKLSQKSLKRTKSHEDLINKQAFKRRTQQTRSNYQDKRRHEEQVFYDMDENKNFITSKKDVQKRQKSSNKKSQQNKGKIKVITTRISQQKNPNLISQFISQLINKQSKIIAGILIILAIGIFLMQLCS